jgi:DNA (cytosine-5)-methyltransferase 1
MLGIGVEVAVPGARTVCHVEREAYAAAILASRMAAKELAPAPVWTDVATFDARRWRGAVDCVLSGDPCQPNSVAGKRGGADDDRFLIDQVVRIFDESGARRLFRENVTGNADGQLAALVPALERLGCRVAVGIWRAADVGAKHGRERLFVMADRDGDGLSRSAQCDGRTAGGQQAPRRCDTQRRHQALGDTAIAGSFPASLSGTHRGHEGGGARDAQPQRRGGALANADGSGRRPEGHERQPSSDAPQSSRAMADAGDGQLQEPRRGSEGRAGPGSAGQILFAPGPRDPRWPAILRDAPHLEPAVRRMAHGLADRVDRLRACGNGVVPLAAARAWIALDALLATDTEATGLVRVMAA